MGDMVLEHANASLGIESVARCHYYDHWLRVRSKLSVEMLVQTRKTSRGISGAQPIKELGLKVGLIDHATNLERGIFPKKGHSNPLS